MSFPRVPLTISWTTAYRRSIQYSTQVFFVKRGIVLLRIWIIKYDIKVNRSLPLSPLCQNDLWFTRTAPFEDTITTSSCVIMKDSIASVFCQMSGAGVTPLMSRNCEGCRRKKAAVRNTALCVSLRYGEIRKDTNNGDNAKTKIKEWRTSIPGAPFTKKDYLGFWHVWLITSIVLCGLYLFNRVVTSTV